MKRNQIAWYLWFIGTVLIVLSWFKVVNNTIGWCGFGMGMVGSVMSWGVRPPKSISEQEQPKLDTDKKD
jgi:hypothetical protein